jgi:hypothetical protein
MPKCWWRDSEQITTKSKNWYGILNRNPNYYRTENPVLRCLVQSLDLLLGSLGQNAITPYDIWWARQDSNLGPRDYEIL